MLGLDTTIPLDKDRPTLAQSDRSNIVHANGTTRPQLTVVVPTRNEAENIEPLLRRLSTTLADISFEVIFVDDSVDDTPQAIHQANELFPFDVNGIIRPPERRNGLGMAVVEGIQAANSAWICVMDGDLQHPPEVVSQLLARAKEEDADLVLGSRLCEGGSTAGLGARRSLISHILALGSRVLFPDQLGDVTDPLTGFFLVNRSAIDAKQLAPDGFKILLDILVRFPQLKVAEVPFSFDTRNAGDSKANSWEVFRLFRHMSHLRFPRFAHLIQFLIVGISGLFVNTGLLALFTELFGLHYLVSAVLATQGSTAWNFAGTEWWVFRKREQKTARWHRFLGFAGMNNGMLLLRAPLLALFVDLLGLHYIIGNLLSLGIMTLLRFALSDRLIWRKETDSTDKKENQMALGFKYAYNIHDIIRVRSMQKLPELGYFRVGEQFEQADIDVYIDKEPTQFQQSDSISYKESAGNYGFSIVVNRMPAVTNVYASPLVGKSPHVLYTNVVEPLLRWQFVRKGYALMHGACLSFDDKALFVTAQTDTGKTTTILHTIRQNVKNARFISDDMTIFSREGRAYCFPKPLTISFHTLNAVGVSPLTRQERLFLTIQSRLHSRSGRWFGMVISALRLPAATLNAIIQRLIPPPKYMIDYLIPDAKYVNSADLSQILLIERNDPLERTIPEAEKVDMLIANAEDAYGFPPYPVLAEQLSSWEGTDMHKLEREIVSEAVNGLPALHSCRNDYGWYQRIPELIDEQVRHEEPAEEMPTISSPMPAFGD